MKSFRILALGLVLSACDELTVTSNIDRMPHFSVGDLWTMQDPRGIPVEIHGSPFTRIADLELAAAMRAPAAAGDGIRFYSTPVGSWQGGHAWRIVLHFHPQGGPNAERDCKLTTEARTNPRPAEGFEVMVSFCKVDTWQAHGFLRALKIDDGDLQSFSQMVQGLMLEIFREEKDI